MLHDGHAECSPNLIADGLTSMFDIATWYILYVRICEMWAHWLQIFPFKLLSTCTPRWPSCAEMPRSYADLGHFSSWMKTLHSTDKSSCMLVEKIMQFLWLLYTPPPLKKQRNEGKCHYPASVPFWLNCYDFDIFLFFLTQLWFCRLSCIIEKILIMVAESEHYFQCCLLNLPTHVILQSESAQAYTGWE